MDDAHRCNFPVKRLFESCKEFAGGRGLKEERRESIEGAQSGAAGGLVEVIVNAKGLWEIRERA